MKDRNKTPPTSKASKAKKNATPDPPPPPPPTNGKKRQPPRMNPEARLAVTSSSSWTGKLPATLLFEHCQKCKWEKVTFDMVSIQLQITESCKSNITRRDKSRLDLSQRQYWARKTLKQAKLNTCDFLLQPMWWRRRKPPLRPGILLPPTQCTVLLLTKTSR